MGSSLTSINLPDGVTSIGEWAFYGCSSLTSLSLPDGVTSIGNWAFQYCSSLTSITLPDGVTSIGEWAFAGCSSLTCIYGSSSVYDLAASAGAHDAANDCTYPPTLSPTMSSPWLHCSHINIPERVVYDSMDYNPMTGDFSMTGVQVGFFNLVRKVVIFAIKREPSQPDVQLGFNRIKITPGTSKFPLKSQPVKNAPEVNITSENHRQPCWRR